LERFSLWISTHPSLALLNIFLSSGSSLNEHFARPDWALNNVTNKNIWLKSIFFWAEWRKNNRKVSV
jgi:hypothetical protein